MRLAPLALIACVLLLPVPVYAQGTSQRVCNIRWSRVASAPPASRAARYREFASACPRDPRARARVRSTPLPSVPIPPRAAQLPPAPPSQVRTQARTRSPPAALRRRAPRIAARQPQLREEVILDAGGGGNTRSLGQALNMVATGGTIRIRPGHYSIGETLTITRSVFLQGGMSGGVYPVIEGAIHIDGGVVFIDGLYLHTPASTNVLLVHGGEVHVSNSQIWFSGTPAPVGAGQDAALFVGGGNVTVSGGVLGPGNNQGVTVGGGSLSVDNATIRGEQGVAFFAYGGSATVSTSRISGRRGFVGQGNPVVDFRNNNFAIGSGNYAVFLTGRPSVTLVNNSFADGSNANWLYSETTVPAAVFAGNRGAGGQLLLVPPAQPPPIR